MAKKIKEGETPFNELCNILELSPEKLYSKKVRLFPIGHTESEVHTTSIFLSSLCAVKEYREEIFSSINVNKIKNNNIQIHAYTEIKNETSEDRVDALIVITSGKFSPVIEWVSFVEVKVGKEIIDQNQIDRYIVFAKKLGIRNILTISNQLVTKPENSPVTTKTNIKLMHWSWPYLVVTAGRLINSNAIKDDDHVYILRELRLYFDSHKKVTAFTNMGTEWPEATSRLRNEKASIKDLEDIVNAVLQEEKDNSFQLTDKTGHHIELVLKSSRRAEFINLLKANKPIVSTYCIDNDKKMKFSVEINFQKRSIKCSTTVVISKGKAVAQTTKLIKLLTKEAGISDQIEIEAKFPRKQNTASALLSDLIYQRENNKPYVILDNDLGETVKCFEVELAKDFKTKFHNKTQFIVEYEKYTLEFFNQVMQEILA